MTTQAKAEAIAAIPKITKPLDTLARECERRGNRLEVMNGKVYEVQRKLLGKIE